MTGAYIRTMRDGRWDNIEIDQLTEEELDALATTQPERGWTWAKFLAKWIREHVTERADPAAAEAMLQAVPPEQQWHGLHRYLQQRPGTP